MSVPNPLPVSVPSPLPVSLPASALRDRVVLGPAGGGGRDRLRGDARRLQRHASLQLVGHRGLPAGGPLPLRRRPRHRDADCDRRLDRRRHAQPTSATNTVVEAFSVVVFPFNLLPRVATLGVVGSTYTPDTDTTDLALIAAPAAAFTITSPTGTPSDGQVLILRISSGRDGPHADLGRRLRLERDRDPALGGPAGVGGRDGRLPVQRGEEHVGLDGSRRDGLLRCPRAPRRARRLELDLPLQHRSGYRGPRRRRRRAELMGRPRSPQTGRPPT